MMLTLVSRVMEWWTAMDWNGRRTGMEWNGN